MSSFNLARGLWTAHGIGVQRCHKLASVQTLARWMSSSSNAEVPFTAAAPLSMAPLYLSYGAATLQGKRRSLSDAVAVVPSFSAMSPPMGLDYFAVFDGYSGTAVARHLQERLGEAIAVKIQHELVTENPRFLRSNDVAEWWRETIEMAFWSVNDELLCGIGVGDVLDVDATALVALVHENYMVLANRGFSKAVISRDGEAVLLTSEHKEDMEDLQEWAGVCMAESKLVKAVQTGRVFGTSICKEEPPEVIRVNRQLKDEFLILASDGLWESLTPASACAFVRERLFSTPSELGTRGPPTLLAKELAEHAISKGSQDNVSVVIILFRNFWSQCLVEVPRLHLFCSTDRS